MPSADCERHVPNVQHQAHLRQLENITSDDARMVLDAIQTTDARSGRYGVRTTGVPKVRRLPVYASAAAIGSRSNPRVELMTVRARGNAGPRQIWHW